MNTRSLYTELTGKISHVRRKEHGIAVQTGIINALTATLALWIIGVSIEAIAEMEPAGRTILFWSLIGLNMAIALWQIVPPLLRYLGITRGQDDDHIARRVGTRIPDVGDRLVNTLQLYRTIHAGALAAGYSPELVEASIAVQGEPLRHYDYTVIIERDERRRALLLFLSAVVLTGTLFLSFPGTYNGALDRLVNYNTEYVKPAPFTLTIAPGDRQLIRGDSVEIVVRAAGIPPRIVRLSLQTGEDEPEEIELRGDSLGVFRYLVPSIRATTHYRAHAGPVRTARHTFTVVERPDIRLLRASVTWPSYTSRGTEQLPDNAGDVSGLRGSAVNITITTNVEPASAAIVQLFPRNVRLASAEIDAAPQPSFDTVRIPMKIEGTSATGGFRLSRDGSYFIALVSPEGVANLSPVEYHMSVSADAPPSIALIQPTGNFDIDRTMILPTQVRIADDYGFSRLRIMYRLSASRYAEPMKDFRPHPITLPRSRSTVMEVPYVWDMTDMDMVPEDEVEIYFEVYDNDVVTGPKMARTEVATVRFPSLEEVLKQADQQQTQASADMEQVLKQAQDARHQMDELNRELMKQLAQNKSQASWQEQRKLQELMQQQEQMQQRLEKIAEDLRAVTEKLQQAKAMSPETLKKYMDLQKLFQEMKNPALMEQMRRLQQEMEKMTPEQIAEAMKNYKYNEEQFRQAIERTMNILKRMQTEQKVDEMIRRAEELAERQERLNEMMKETGPDDRAMQQGLAERQRDLANQAEQMKQMAKELEKQMAEAGEEMPLKEMQDAQQSLEQNGPDDAMQQAGERMEQGDMDQAQQMGQQAGQSARDFQKKMQSVKKKMQENSQKAVTNKMKKALQDLLDLSRRQEQLKDQTEKTQANSPQFRDLARQQEQMKEQMENIANQMMSLGQKSFAVTPEMGKEMGDAIRQMQGATQSLEQRDGFNAGQQEGGAMSSMNNAAKMMADAIQQMQNGQSGQGMGFGMGASMQQRLQQAAAQQQMINQAMQGQQGAGQQGQGQEGEGEGEGKEGKGKDGRNGEGDGSGEGEGSEMRRLRRQQQDVKKSIEELNREVKESGGTRKNMIGDLERAAQEIEEVLSDMRSGQITPETLQRQERILSRLLDATRSQRERDFEKKRESTPGVDVVRQSPPDLRFPDRNDDQVRRDQLRSREQGYTKDYEYMIRRYFEALSRGNGAAAQ